MSNVTTPVIAQNEENSALDIELEQIARDIVESLGYSGAMVAAYERGDALPVRAIYTDPAIASIEKIREWEKQVQKISPKRFRDRISITDPTKARVYLHQEEYSGNLSVKAAEKGSFVVSDNLFDLFVPIVPDIGVVRQIVKVIQNALKIKQVVAVPFFIDGEYVGNLFAASEKDFSPESLRVLNAFAHRAASSIRSERRRLQGESNQKLILDMQRDISSEDKILKRIVQGVVEDLGYTGAMVATYELGGALPARATYLDPSIMPMGQIEKWEKQIQSIAPGSKISITDPAIARVYLDQPEYENNLSVKAAKEKKPVVSNELFFLFTPIVPDKFVVRRGVKAIQNALKIKQVIAVPFFIDGEYWGNLFAITQSEKFSNWEIELLQAFGQNAAAGLRNAKLYKQSEDRRDAAQIFGRMAFSAATSVHAFRGHAGAINLGLDLLKSKEDAKEREEYVEKLKKRVKQIAEILDSLHTPWNVQHDVDVNVDACLKRALEKVLPDWRKLDWVKFNVKDGLPTVKTSQEMLTEAFRNLVKNAKEAIEEKNGSGLLVIESNILGDSSIEIKIQDNGIGIRPENYEKVFELRWGTKQSGLGFGLFWTKDYIEGLKGSIRFVSKFGEGTTFIVTLPTQPANR